MSQGYLGSSDPLCVTQEAHPKNAYDTPVSLCVPAMALLSELSPFKRPLVFDPGLGDFGPFGWALSRIDYSWRPWGIDLRPVPERPWYRQQLVGDYLTTPLQKFDIITGNPPFSLAEEFIWRSLDLLSLDGQIFFLLKLRFQEGIGRANGILSSGYLRHIFPLPKRPPWWLYKRPASRGDKEDRSTNSEPYAFFLFSQKKVQGDPMISWRLRWDFDEALERQFRKEAGIDA